MTYRLGHHSTSDDSTRYRSLDEIEKWRQENNPITRLYQFLSKQQWISQDDDAKLKDNEKNQVLAALLHAEKKPKPELEDSLFKDIYDEVPNNLKEQQQKLQEHLIKYPHHNMDDH